MGAMSLQKTKIICLYTIIIFLTIYFISFWWPWVTYFITPPQINLLTHGNYHATRLRPGGCPWKLIYARPSESGRFGNRLIEYASAWAVARQHNLTAVISDGIAKALEPSFEGLSIVSKSKYIASLRLKDNLCAEWVELELEKAPIGENDEDVKKLLADQSSTRKPISIRPHVILEQFIVPVRKSLRQELHKHPTLAAYVNKVLQYYSKMLRKKRAETTFVGVHVRLGDYPTYLKRFGKVARPVDVKYYLHATNYMIQELKKTKASNIVFLVVSDDEIWCKSNLIPALEQLLFSKKWSRGTLAVRWSGSSFYRQDFALLSSCNHSIIAYGTFAGGAALLAGGMTVVYDINRGKGGLKGSAMAFAQMIPEWKLLF